jgi:hypothetical protein
MFFTVSTLIVAVPTGVKIFSWVATLWGGKLRLNSAMLFAIGLLAMFVLGGLSGVTLGTAPSIFTFTTLTTSSPTFTTYCLAVRSLASMRVSIIGSRR